MKDMSEIIVPETTIAPEQYSYNGRQLVMTILHQAAKDYCRNESESTRKAILKDLRSSYMEFISDGMSVVVAEQLEKNCEAIKARISKEEDEL